MVGENVFSDPNVWPRRIFIALRSRTVLTTSSYWANSVVKFGLVFLTGILVGVSLEWLNRKSDAKKLPSSEASALNFAAFQIASKFARVVRMADNVRDLKSVILSALVSARKFDLWVRMEHVVPIAGCVIPLRNFRCVGKL